MGGTVGFMTNMFFVLLLGAIFAQIFEKSGAALSIANTILKVFVKGEIRSSRGILTVVISQIAIAAIFMFGGIDGMTELITVFPICLAMCKRMNITRNLVPALAFTTGVWAMCSPGSTSGSKLSGCSFMRNHFYSRSDSWYYCCCCNGSIYNLVSVF